MDLYTADGRTFALNRHEGDIRDQLEIGTVYRAVYSTDLSHHIIRSLSDGKLEYLNLDESIRIYKRDTIIWILTAVISLLLLALVNCLYVRATLKKERRRLRDFQRAKKADK